MLIGEVSAASGISTRMLRHYDRIGLVSPSGRTAGGYRRYADADLRRLFHVEGLRTLGLSLREIGEALDGQAFDAGALVARLTERTRRRLQEEQQLLARLEQVRATGPADWPDVLRTIGLMRRLQAASPAERQRAALGADHDRDAVVLVEAALSEPEVNVAGTLQWALAQNGDEAVPALASALSSADADRRLRAVEALRKIGTPTARDALSRAAGHPDIRVAAPATLARGRTGDHGAIPALVALVSDGPDDVEAAEVLAELAVDHRSSSAITDALAEAYEAGDEHARRRVIAALTELPGSAAEALLVRALDDPDRGTSLTAAAVLRSRNREGGRTDQIRT